MKSFNTKFYASSFLILVSTFFYSCHQSCNCEINSKVIAKNDSLLQWMDTSGRLDMIHKHYTIPDIRNTNESYQLSILSSFGKNQVYTLSKTDSSYLLKQKIISSKNYEQFVTTSEKEINAKTFHKIKYTIDTSCFWSMSVDEPKRSILDGSTWALEGFNSQGNSCTFKTYHHVSRNTPDSSVFKNICLDIMKLGNSNLK